MDDQILEFEIHSIIYQTHNLSNIMYAIGTLPLITQLQGFIKQSWYADDAAGGGDILSFKRWWDLLLLLGPRYSYFPNRAKSWLVVKEGVEDTTREVFCDSDIHITGDGHCNLAGVIGSEAYEQQFLQQKVQDWISDIKKLSTIAESQPHAAYSAYCHGLSFWWNYFFRVCTSSPSLFQPLEDCICSDLILKLLGRDFPGKVERDLFSLPVRLGGLGLFIPTVTAARQHNCSLYTSSPLVDLIVSQSHDTCTAFCFANHVQLRSEIHATQ